MTGNRSETDATALYVATDLTCWETDAPRMWAADVGIDGTCFRRLDPEFYAWLRQQVARAQRAFDLGRLAHEAFEQIRCRFNEVHAWAMAHLGEAVLLAAVNAPARPYQPPTMEDLETVRLGITDPGPRRRR
jgi:hypothetical protein